MTMLRNIAFLTLALTTGFASAAPIAAPLSFTSDANVAYHQSLGKAEKDSVVVGFNFNYTGKVADNNFLGLWFGNASNLAEAYKGPSFGFKSNCGTDKCGKDDLFVRTGGTGGTFLKNSDLVAGTDYYLFAHLYKSGASDYFDRLDMWLNPTGYEMQMLTGADATATERTNLKSVDTIGFRTAFVSSGVTLNVNDLRVGEVPEPGSVALMGLALAGLALTRRNKRG